MGGAAHVHPTAEIESGVDVGTGTAIWALSRYMTGVTSLGGASHWRITSGP